MASMYFQTALLTRTAVSNKVIHRDPAPGRPRGDFRTALERAAVELCAQGGGANWRALAAHAQVGQAAAATTIKNMVRAGALVPCGEERVPHSRRPMKRYRPAGQAPGCGFEQLMQTMRTWR